MSDIMFKLLYSLGRKLHAVMSHCTAVPGDVTVLTVLLSVLLSILLLQQVVPELQLSVLHIKCYSSKETNTCSGVTPPPTGGAHSSPVCDSENQFGSRKRGEGEEFWVQGFT